MGNPGVPSDYQIAKHNLDAGKNLCSRCQGTGNELFNTYRACQLCGGDGIDSGAVAVFCVACDRRAPFHFPYCQLQATDEGQVAQPPARVEPSATNAPAVGAPLGGMRLDGRVVIVTGGAQGLGRGYALRLAAEGAAVVIADREGGIARDLAAGLPRAIAVEVDVRDAAAARRLADEALQAFGRVDVLVNNAGGILVRSGPFWEWQDHEWDLCVDVNLKGAWQCTKAVLPTMRRQGTGKVINISSASFFRPSTPSPVAYVAAKGGVVGLTRAMARELGPFGITVNAIAPGMVLVSTRDAERPKAESERLRREVVSQQMLARPGLEEDLAGLVVFLASDDANFMTGQVLTVDGGWTLH